MGQTFLQTSASWASYWNSGIKGMTEKAMMLGSQQHPHSRRKKKASRDHTFHSQLWLPSVNTTLFYHLILHQHYHWLLLLQSHLHPTDSQKFCLCSSKHIYLHSWLSHKGRNKNCLLASYSSSTQQRLNLHHHQQGKNMSKVKICWSVNKPLLQA